MLWSKRHQEARMWISVRNAGARFAGVAVALLQVVLMVALLAPTPAAAQRRVPDRLGLEAMIKSTLLTFNDANVTGNYTVLHAKLSKPFRDQYSPERLKEVFKAFADNRIDFDVIAAKIPIFDDEPKITASGILMLKGHFDTNPNVNYDIDYIESENAWRPIKINVRLGRPEGQ